jgi:tetratricopeptide (TPR) repeat protein
MKTESLTPADLEKKAISAYRKGHLEEALSNFTAAKHGYEIQINQAKIAEMANSLCVVHLQMNQPEDALQSVKETPAIFIHIGDQERAAMAYGNLASALEACGQLDKAEETYKQAADIFERLGDVDNRALTLQSLSQLQLRRGHSLEAASSMQAGLRGKTHHSLKESILQRLLNTLLHKLGF